MRALIVVDVQNDFCEGGSLQVTGGAQVAADVTAHLGKWSAGDISVPAYQVAVATKDHHIDPGPHWSPDPDYKDSWPVHCEVGTDGEEFHPDLDASVFAEVFRKGKHEAAYSGFEGTNEAGSTLAEWLRQQGISDVDVCGIATDYCVKATALDAVKEGFHTRLLTTMCAGVAPDTSDAALAEMTAAGIDIV